MTQTGRLIQAAGDGGQETDWRGCHDGNFDFAASSLWFEMEFSEPEEGLMVD